MSDTPLDPEDVIAHYRSRAAAFSARTLPARKARARRRAGRKPQPPVLNPDYAPLTRDEVMLLKDESLLNITVAAQTGRRPREVAHLRRYIRYAYTTAQREVQRQYDTGLLTRR